MKKNKYIFLSLLILFFFSNGYSQKATITAKLLDSSFHDASKFNFQIEIKNIGFDKYWIQDTSFLKTHLEYPFENLIYPYMEKEINGVYKIYEKHKHRPGYGLRDECLDSCCNCIFLQKGEGLKMNLPTLKCYNMETGQYRMQIMIAPPLMSCHACEQGQEIYSEFLYFTVNN